MPDVVLFILGLSGIFAGGAILLDVSLDKGTRRIAGAVLLVGLLLMAWFIISINSLKPKSVEEYPVWISQDQSVQYILTREGVLINLNQRFGRILPKDAVVLRLNHISGWSYGVLYWLFVKDDYIVKEIDNGKTKD